MDEWIAVAVLPNLKMDEALNSKFLCLAPRGDERVSALELAHPSYKRFMSGFTDAFGVKLSPTVLILRSDAPKSLKRMEAWASFRDLVSMSVVPLNRSLELDHPRGHRVTWANVFSIYPWTIDTNNRYLVANTPALLGLHQPESFHGQSASELPVMSLRHFNIDKPLLDALIQRWQTRYRARHAQRSDHALFRSLNMANQAAALPAGSDATFYDFGRLVPLWVSAFEILAHARYGRANLETVYNLLQDVDWQIRRLRHRRHRTYERSSKTAARRTLACFLYGKLYQARNDFIHGNPIKPMSLNVRQSKLPIIRFAAPLYRLALTSFLDLKWNKPMPPMSQPKRFGRYVAEHSAFYLNQKNAERALLVAIALPTKDED